MNRGQKTDIDGGHDTNLFVQKQIQKIFWQNDKDDCLRESTGWTKNNGPVLFHWTRQLSEGKPSGNIPLT